MTSSAPGLAPRFSLRPAKDDDIAGLRLILAETWRATYAPLLGDAAVDRMEGELLSDAALRKTLADGLTLLATRETDQAPAALVLARGQDDVFIQRLYVRPFAQGSGLGRALLSAVEAATRALRIRLDVEAGNEAALAFYRAMGFVETGRGEDMIAGIRFAIRRLEKATGRAG